MVAHRNQNQGAASHGGERVKILPCLDVKEGRVVKGVRFAGLRDAGDPVELAALYEAQGADELVVLDISATGEGRRSRIQVVRQIREVVSIPIIAGGGVGSVEDAEVLLQAGVDQVSLSSAALKNPQVLSRIGDRFGRERVVLAIDGAPFARAQAAEGARRGDGEGPWEALGRAGTERTGVDVVQFARLGTRLGAGRILLTSRDRDGLTSGYDLPLIRAVTSAVDVPVIASGGAGSPEHMLEGIRAGATGVLAASIFHDGTYTVADLKQWLAARGVSVG